MEVLKIDYGTGQMVLVVRNFFRCTVKKARIVFPLIHRWCDGQAKAELMKEFTEMASGYEALARVYKERNRKTDYSKAMALYKRINRNIEFLSAQNARSSPAGIRE